MILVISIFAKPRLDRFQYYLLVVLKLVAFSYPFESLAQQIHWAKVYPLEKRDEVRCITQDADHNLYVGGSTARNPYQAYTGTLFDKAVIIKLDSNGDTAFVKDLGIPGSVLSLAVDPFGMIRANVRQLHTNAQLVFHTYYVWMLPEGTIFRMDSIDTQYFPNCSIIGRDSSLIIAGQKWSSSPGTKSMYFQRVTKDWTIEQAIELNPGHPNCVANRVEQLPNGHYLVSGYVGSRIASYELDEYGSNPVFKQWYQSADFSNMTKGYVSRINGQRYMIGGEGGPCVVGQYDTLLNKYWLKKDIGSQVAPQAMTDGSVVFGYLTSIGPPNPFYRLKQDSSTFWYVSIKDSLIAKGINNAVDISSFSYFEDQSAVLAGIVQNTATNRDPIFLRIANVGTPVTSLLKPKKGPLANETLAPWPNPTGGTLYLKQHFNKAEIHLYNLSGKEMGEYRIGFAQPIDISGYESGVYLYRAVIDGKFYSGKVVKR